MRSSLLLSLVFALPALAQDGEQPTDDAAKPDLAKTTTPGANVQAAPPEKAEEKADEKAEEKAEEKAADAPEAKPEPKPKPKPKPKKVEQPADDGLPAWPTDDGATTGATPGNEMAANWDAATGPVAEVSYPFVEQHGYFRTRADLFHNLDLDTYDLELGRGSSPFLPPLTELDTQGSDHLADEDPDNPHNFRRGADSVASTNIRFRYQPTLHINENLRVRTTVDVLDNLVLGSTPDGSRRIGYDRPDSPFETFSGSQRPPESRVSDWRDSMRVKHLWGEWKTPLGLLMMGRTASHWGLGVLANNGGCLDCDFGDSVDRIMGVTKLFGTYLAIAWDFPSEGFVGFSGQHSNPDQPFGQQHDFDQRDDVNEYVVAIFQRPLTAREKDERHRLLNSERKSAFDWGVYNVIRTQEFTTEGAGSIAATYDQEGALRDVKAFAWIPDVTFSWEYRPQRNHHYKIGFEAAGIFGVIREVPFGFVSDPKEVCLEDGRRNPSVDPEDCSGEVIKPRERDILQYGAAFEFDARQDKLKFGVRAGLASGDDTDGFGVLDKPAIDAQAPNDQEVTSFKFDRDYTIDLILFREIIGTITNAHYYKPYVGYDFILQDDEAWGIEFSALYAQAVEAKATPGNEAPLGLEFDLELYVHEFDRFKWSLQYGILFPLGAFDLLDDQEASVVRTPGVAQTLQMMVGMEF